MLDIQLIRDNPEAVKDGVRKKGYDPALVDRVLDIDKEWREMVQKVEILRAQQKKAERAQAQKIKQDLKILEPKLRELEGRRKPALYQIPNLPDPAVPIGKDENQNVELRAWGKPKKFDFPPKDHLELGRLLNIIDIDRTVRISGARFASLKNEAVLLEFALVDLAMKTALKEGFVPIIPPVLISEGNAENLGYFDTEEGRENYFVVIDYRCYQCRHYLGIGSKQVFCRECEEGGKKGKWVEQEITRAEITEDARLKCHNCGRETRLASFYLVGTAEHTIVQMHMVETFEESEVPKRYVGFSTAFRREAGTYGKDMKGITRLHQFDKVEFVSFAHPAKSKEELEYLLALEEKLWQALGLPYRVVQLCTGELARPSAETYDIEAWLPGEGRYKEVSSASNTTAFQARRLDTKLHTKEGENDFVHILNATGFAIGRTLVAILENYQQKDGSVRIPEVLQPYMGGIKEIRPKGK